MLIPFQPFFLPCFGDFYDSVFHLSDPFLCVIESLIPFRVVLFQASCSPALFGPSLCLLAAFILPLLSSSSIFVITALESFGGVACLHFPEFFFWGLTCSCLWTVFLRHLILPSSLLLFQCIW